MSLPQGYIELAYIRSSGQQYINTGFKPNNNTRITADFELTKSGSDWRCIFGARDSSMARCFALFFSTDNLFYSNVGSKDSTHFFTSQVSVLGRHTVDMNQNMVEEESTKPIMKVSYLT